MDNYLLAVICCLSPFVISGIWFAVLDNDQDVCKKSEITKSPITEGAKNFMLRAYFYNEYDSPSLSNELLEKLKKVNLYDPKIRSLDYMDCWFKDSTLKLMHDGKCLAYINHYGHLEDTFWKNIDELNLKPQRDVKFQQLLVSVSKTSWEIWIQNFSNLLFHYGKLYELLPEIKKIIDEDPRFVDAKKTYEIARQHFGSYNS